MDYACRLLNFPIYRTILIMKNITWLLTLIISATAILSCGDSYQQSKEKTRAERKRLAREDSMALKVAVMPSLDCLPLYVAQRAKLFETFGSDIRLKTFTAHMDCDTALAGQSAEIAMTDIVRMEYMKSKGAEIEYVGATGNSWQLIASKFSRIRQLKQLDDKMVAMTRFSITDMLSDHIADSMKIEREKLFKVQVNDTHVRLIMLTNNEIDAAWLSEPHATQARIAGNKVLADSRKMDIRMGVMAKRTDKMKGKARDKQFADLIKAYNMACDSINKYGLSHYGDLIKSKCHVDDATIKRLPSTIKFHHLQAPRQQDIDKAQKWINTL